MTAASSSAAAAVKVYRNEQIKRLCIRFIHNLFQIFTYRRRIIVSAINHRNTFCPEILHYFITTRRVSLLSLRNPTAPLPTVPLTVCPQFIPTIIYLTPHILYSLTVRTVTVTNLEQYILYCFRHSRVNHRHIFQHTYTLIRYVKHNNYFPNCNIITRNLLENI